MLSVSGLPCIYDTNIGSEYWSWTELNALHMGVFSVMQIVQSTRQMSQINLLKREHEPGLHLFQYTFRRPKG